MNTANSRFRINALIQMARTTENLDKRERYIAQAEEELEEMKSGKCQSTPLEVFFMKNARLEKISEKAEQMYIRNILSSARKESLLLHQEMHFITF